MAHKRLASLVIAACAILASSSRAVCQDPASPPAGSVHGTVTLTGPRPVRETWPVPEEMRPFHTGDVFEDEAWLIGEKGELKNCVITLTPTEGTPARPAPLEGVVYRKVGIRYEPRVIVVTSGTEVTFRNVDSPCNGFTFRSVRGPQLNTMIGTGSERKIVLEGKGPAPILCNLREYMRGAFYFTDTPYYAVSAADGTYTIAGVPPGRYRARLWHEVLGYVDKKKQRHITVAAGEATEASWTVPSPRREPSPADDGIPVARR